MKTCKSLFITWIFTVAYSCDGNRQTTVTEDKPNDHNTVKSTIEQAIGWAIEKDFDAMYRLWADDLFPAESVLYGYSFPDQNVRSVIIISRTIL